MRRAVSNVPTQVTTVSLAAPLASTRHATTWEWLVVVALPVLAMATIHLPAMSSALAIAPGDEGDARIMVFLLESMMRGLLAGGHNVLSPGMFFPVRGVLSYTDAHLLWLPLYAAFRTLGLEPVRAFAGLMLTLLLYGYATFWLLMRRALGLRPAPAAVGATLFVFGNALTVKLIHGQMIGVTVLPTILLLLHQAWHRQRWWAGIAAGLLIGALAATSFIVTWTFLLFAAGAGLIGLAVIPAFRHGLLGREGRAPFLGTLTGLAIGIVPFAYIYHGQILYGQRRPWQNIFFYHPYLSDLLDLGERNALYSPLLKHVGIPVVPSEIIAERFFGSSPPVWLLCLAGAVLVAAGWRGANGAARALLLGFVATAVVTFAEFPYGTWWPWRLVLNLPGASAIRTPFRTEIVALVPICALAALALDRVVRLRRVGSALFLTLSAAALLESAFAEAPYRLRAADEHALLAGIPHPPSGCRVFAITPQPPGRIWWQIQDDSLVLALHWHLPTINGNNSWYPDDWGGLKDPMAPGYGQALATWIKNHALRNEVCLYDEAAQRWLAADEVQPLAGQG